MFKIFMMNSRYLKMKTKIQKNCLLVSLQVLPLPKVKNIKKSAIIFLKNRLKCFTRRAIRKRSWLTVKAVYSTVEK